MQPPIKCDAPKYSPGCQLHVGVSLICLICCLHMPPIAFVNSEHKKKFSTFVTTFSPMHGKSPDDIILSSAWYQRAPHVASCTWICGSWYADVPTQSCLFCRDMVCVFGVKKKSCHILQSDIMLIVGTSESHEPHISVLLSSRAIRQCISPCMHF